MDQFGRRSKFLGHTDARVLAKLPFRPVTGGRACHACPLFMRSQANASDQQPGTADHPFSTRVASLDSLHLACYAATTPRLPSTRRYGSAELTDLLAYHLGGIDHGEVAGFRHNLRVRLRGVHPTIYLLFWFFSQRCG